MIFLALAGALYGSYKQNISLKPAPSPAPSEPQPAPEPQWYVQFTVKNTKITAYTESSYALPASSGQPYTLGGIAVHPIYPGADPRIPRIPFGTRVYLNKPVVINGQNYDTFTVIDTGDVNYRLWSQRPYWFDIYYGPADYWSNQGAKKFGVQERDYTWFEKWR